MSSPSSSAESRSWLASFLGYQQSPAQGLINLVAGIVALFVGVLLVRVLLELALAILRIAEGIERATHPAN